MLQFYSSRLSVNGRRVWVTLLEKNLDFELSFLKLDGDQFRPDFIKLNPFHHVPVLVDDDFEVFESLAILDYLEAKYPEPFLMPTKAKDIAKVRMIELVTVNELPPASIILMKKMLEVPVENTQVEKAQQSLATALQYFEDNLELNKPYFIGEKFTYAEIVAGTAVDSIPLLGISLEPYPQVSKWLAHLQQRDSWKQTAPSPEEIEQSKAIMKSILQKR